MTEEFITDRSADGWVAVTEDYEPGHPIGFGHTEKEAIDDLRWLLRPTIRELARQEDVANVRRTFQQQRGWRRLLARIGDAIDGITR